MAKLSAAITGVHGYVPDYILTNKELEGMVDTNDEWIRSRTGISERRILKGEGLGASDMAAEAIRGLLAKTGSYNAAATRSISIFTSTYWRSTACSTLTAHSAHPDH